MSKDQIKHMVDRFLNWRLPGDFAPDAGISFKAAFNEHTAHPMKHEPTGTNLFTATQADAMVRHMVDGLSLQDRERAKLERLRLFVEALAIGDPRALRDVRGHAMAALDMHPGEGTP